MSSAPNTAFGGFASLSISGSGSIPPYPDCERDPRQALDYFAESCVNACEAATDYLRKPGGVEVVKEALRQDLITDEEDEKIREAFLHYTDDGPGGVELLGCASCGERDYSPFASGRPEDGEEAWSCAEPRRSEGDLHVHVSQLDPCSEPARKRYGGSSHYRRNFRLPQPTRIVPPKTGGITIPSFPPPSSSPSSFHLSYSLVSHAFNSRAYELTVNR